MADQKFYAVFCENDDGEHVLATRTLFPTRISAATYCGALPSRHPIAVVWDPKRWAGMRHDWKERFGSEALAKQRDIMLSGVNIVPPGFGAAEADKAAQAPKKPKG